VRSDAVDFVVDSLLGVSIDKEVVPKAESNYIAKANIGPRNPVRVCNGLGRLCTTRIAGQAPVTIMWKGRVTELVVKIPQAQKLDIISMLL
jgi:hypothetical protein